MKKELFTLKGVITALFVAAFFVVAGSSFGAIKADAAVSFRTRTNADSWKTPFDNTKDVLFIKSGVYNSNAVQIKLSDTKDRTINVYACPRNLKYKRTYYKKNTEDETYVLRFSFFTTKKNQFFDFKFRVDGTIYKLRVFAGTTDPVKEAKFGKTVLSNRSGELGASDCVTELKKETLSVKMNSDFALVSIERGAYKNSEDSYLTFKKIKNRSKLSLSDIAPENSKTVDSDESIYEDSMIAPTVIRINYRIKKTGTTAYYDYYINRLVSSDN